MFDVAAAVVVNVVVAFIMIFIVCVLFQSVILLLLMLLLLLFEAETKTNRLENKSLLIWSFFDIVSNPHLQCPDNITNFVDENEVRFFVRISAFNAQVLDRNNFFDTIFCSFRRF